MKVIFFTTSNLFIFMILTRTAGNDLPILHTMMDSHVSARYHHRHAYLKHICLIIDY